MALSSGNEKWLLSCLTRPLSLTLAASLEPVKGEQTHSVYKLVDQGTAYAVKQFTGKCLAMFSRKEQMALQHRLAARGIAPKPIWFDAEQGIWVECWVDSSHTCPDSQVNKKPRVEVIVDAISAIHSLDVVAPQLDLSAEWDAYIELIDGELPTALRTKIQACATTLEHFLEPVDQVMCHCDLALAHIVNLDPLCVVDWEYAARANRYFDLASICAVNALGAVERETLMRCYAAAFSLDKVKVTQSVEAFLPIVEVTVALWELALAATDPKLA